MKPRNDRTSFALLIDSRRLVGGKQLGQFFFECRKTKAKTITSTSVQSLEAIKQTKTCNQSTAREKFATGAKRWKMCFPVMLRQNM